MSNETQATIEANKSAREALEAQIKALSAENAELMAKQRKVFEMKVSEKGAVSVYGLGRFPVTLYKDQWLDVIFANSAEIIAFIKATEAQQVKNQKSYVPPKKEK